VRMRQDGSTELSEAHEAITPGSYFQQEKRRRTAMGHKRISSRLAVAASAVVLAAGLAVSSASAASAETDTPTASAATAPTVSFSFTQQTVDSGDGAQLTYSGWNLPARSEIFLQLAYGTPTQWYFAEPLSGTAGTATLPGLPTGLYEFRLVAEQGITVVAISPARYLSVVQSGGCGLICSIIGGLGGAIGAIVSWLLSLF
jgi:hypothetical protein